MSLTSRTRWERWRGQLSSSWVGLRCSSGTRSRRNWRTPRSRSGWAAPTSRPRSSARPSAARNRRRSAAARSSPPRRWNRWSSCCFRWAAAAAAVGTRSGWNHGSCYRQLRRRSSSGVGPPLRARDGHLVTNTAFLLFLFLLFCPYPEVNLAHSFILDHLSTSFESNNWTRVRFIQSLTKIESGIHESNDGVKHQTDITDYIFRFKNNTWLTCVVSGSDKALTHSHLCNLTAAIYIFQTMAGCKFLYYLFHLLAARLMSHNWARSRLQNNWRDRSLSVSVSSLLSPSKSCRCFHIQREKEETPRAF